MTVTPTDIGFQFLSRSLQISICLHVRREKLFINVSISIDTVQVPVLKKSNSELKYLHLLLFQCFWVHLRKRTKLFQFRSALTQLQLLMATSGNCVNYGSHGIWYVIVKLQTDDLAMAAEILLGIKISAIRLNKDDNLPEYNVECLLQATFVPKHFSFVKREKIVYKMLLYRYWWNIDTDEIPGFFLLLKNHIFIARSEDTIFNFHVWGSWCHRGFTGASRSRSSEISFIKWLRGAKTVQLPVTFASAAMSCQIFTSILFPSVMIIQEDLPKSRK